MPRARTCKHLQDRTATACDVRGALRSTDLAAEGVDERLGWDVSDLPFIQFLIGRRGRFD
jgi:hypothetical protein